jgi:putative DNA primase/helicase
MFIGDPGLGKSLVTLSIAATVTRGDAWPDLPSHSQPAGSVLIFSAEDDPEDTIMPRLDQAGAVTSRVRIVKAVDEGNGRQRHFRLDRDLPRLE